MNFGAVFSLVRRLVRLGSSTNQRAALIETRSVDQSELPSQRVNGRDLLWWYVDVLEESQGLKHLLFAHKSGITKLRTLGTDHLIYGAILFQITAMKEQ